MPLTKIQNWLVYGITNKLESHTYLNIIINIYKMEDLSPYDEFPTFL